MPEIVYYVAASLDGYIATSDGGVEWLDELESTGEDYGYTEFYESVDDLLMGSRTYEQCLTFGDWPYPGKQSWVFTQRQIEPARPDIFVTNQTPKQLVEELEPRNLKKLWLVGGAEIAESFRADGLITEHIVSIIPVILGSGIPLFASGGQKETLKLSGHTAYKSGIVQVRYVPVQP
jgi:dihydrofolate reductase